MGTAIDPRADPFPGAEDPLTRERDTKVDNRLLDIDRAKGLGIALVVWGHIPSTSTPGLPLWLYVSVSIIYYFHMPLFMYLSGYVFFLSGSQDRFWKAPLKRTVIRFNRLMIPCLIFAALIVVGTYFAASIGPVDDRVEGIGEALGKIVTNAPGNPAISLWYLIVLFIYVIITPVLWRLGGRSFIPILLLGGVGWALPLSDAYYVGRIGTYFIFFAVGGFFAMHNRVTRPLLARWFAPALLVFGALCYALLGHPLAMLICGLASIPALHGLFLQKFWNDDRLMLVLGRNSMAIYLMNTIMIGIAKILYLRYFPYDGLWLLPFISVVFTVGLVGPIWVRMTLGASPKLKFVKSYLD
jgi:fucose 4-O-acetylase-like acetyltransferase